MFVGGLDCLPGHFALDRPDHRVRADDHRRRRRRPPARGRRGRRGWSGRCARRRSGSRVRRRIEEHDAERGVGAGDLGDPVRSPTPAASSSAVSQLPQRSSPTPPSRAAGAPLRLIATATLASAPPGWGTKLSGASPGARLRSQTRSTIASPMHTIGCGELAIQRETRDSSPPDYNAVTCVFDHFPDRGLASPRLGRSVPAAGPLHACQYDLRDRSRAGGRAGGAGFRQRRTDHRRRAGHRHLLRTGAPAFPPPRRTGSSTSPTRST